MSSPRLRSAVLLALGFVPALFASPIDPVIKDTPHLRLVSDRKLAPRLDSLAALSEATWARLCQATGFAPRERITLVLHDEDDYSNGWAYAASSWVNVWLTPLQFELRGGTDWERNVIAHEMAHVFTLRALGYDGTFVSATGTGNRTTRTHSLAGSMSLSFNRCEAWLAEGMAQLGSQLCGADRWDAQRDMLERIAWQEGTLLDDGLTRTFWGDGRESEQTYNQGYSFLRFVLAKGSADFPTLLHEGRRTSLRKAIEASLGMNFPKALAAWRTDIGLRQASKQLPSQSAHLLLEPAQAATWTVQTSPVAVGTQRWLLSSHANDYARLELWETDGHKAKFLAEDIEGRLHLSPEKNRLLAVRQDLQPNRDRINDLWEYTIPTRTWRRITTRSRVVDGTTFGSGFAIVRRDSGHAIIEQLDAQGKAIRRLPNPATGNPVQVASSPEDALWLTVMSSVGYRILRWQEDSGWLDAIRPDREAKDPLWAEGHLWFSTLSDGRWAAARLDQEQVTIMAEACGGLFTPFPVGDSLLVGEYRKEGLLARMLPSRPRRPSPQPFDSAVSRPSLMFADSGSRLRPLPFALPEIMAWGLSAGYRSTTDSIGRFTLGQQWVAGAGMLLGDARDDFQASVDAELVRPFRGDASGHAVSLGITSTAHAPIISLQAWEEALPLQIRHAATDSDDTFDEDTLPVVTGYGISAQILQQFTSHAYGFALWQHQRNGLGTTRSNGYSLTLLETSLAAVGLAYQDLEAGRYGPWEGVSGQLSLARVWPRPSSRMGIGIDYTSYAAHLRLVTNVRRRILFDWTTDGSWSVPDRLLSPRGSASSGVTAGVPLPLPALQLASIGSRKLVLVSPLFTVGPRLALEPRSRLESSLTPSCATSSSLLQHSGIELAGLRSPFPGNVRAGGSMDLSLSATALTFGNLSGTWSVGVSLPWEETSDLSRLRWSASISL